MKSAWRGLAPTCFHQKLGNGLLEYYVQPVTGPCTSQKNVLKIKSTIFIILKIETLIQFTFINFHAKANTFWNTKDEELF